MLGLILKLFSTTDDSILGEFVQTLSLYLLYTLYALALTLYHSHSPTRKNKMDLIKHTNAKADF
jgi:hypothetical protein